MIKTKAKYFLFLILLLPIYFGFLYQDSFYFIIALCVFGIIYFILNPNLLNRKIRLPQSHTKYKHVQSDNRINNSSLIKFESFKKIDRYIPIIVGSLVLLLSLTYVGVTSLVNVPEKNIYLKYLLSLFKYSFGQGSWLILLIIIYVGGVVFYSKKKITNIIGNVLSSMLLVFVSLFLVVNFAFITTFIFAIGELNVMSVRSKFGLIVSGKDAVSKRLKTYKKAPHIIGKDYKIDNLTIYKAIQKDEVRGSLYEEAVINALPKVFTSFFSLPKDNLVLFGNYLLVREINKQDIQQITGTLVKILIQDTLSSKYIKDEPKYEVIGRQDYLKYREDQINKDIRKIEGYIESETSKIDTINVELNKAYAGIKANNDAIENARNKIRSNEAAINSANSSKNSDYASCMNDGYFFYDTYIKSHSQSYCNSQSSMYDSYIAQYQKNIQDWSSSINEYQGYISEWNKLVSLYENRIVEIKDGIKLLQGYKGLLEAKKGGTVYELGVFIPEKDIKLALDDVSSKSLADFLATAVHEYLHYTSYVSEEKSNNFEPFFEESLTEYFARDIIKKDLNITTGQGYPLFTRIISEIAKKTKGNDLLEIYLTKDQNRLQGTLDSIYGKDFYKNTQSYFIQLYYSAADNELKIANNIMFRIGGKQIKEKELYSTSSELK